MRGNSTANVNGAGHSRGIFACDDLGNALGQSAPFTGILAANRELIFPISMPASMVNAKGQRLGRARLTLVYRPPIDSRFDRPNVVSAFPAAQQQSKPAARFTCPNATTCQLCKGLRSNVGNEQ